MSRKSPSIFKILKDTLDLMTLMTHCVQCAFLFVQSLKYIYIFGGVRKNSYLCTSFQET